jgi:hypothetical protein
MQMHRRQWVCPFVECSSKFSEKLRLQTHLQDKHPKSFSSTQIPILIDICERAEDLSDDSDCALCLGTLPLQDLQTHLACHLEELALFVLPLTENAVLSDGNSANSGVIDIEPNPHLDEVSSLGAFSDVGEKNIQPENLQENFKLQIEVNEPAPNSVETIFNWQESNVEKGEENLDSEDTTSLPSEGGTGKGIPKSALHRATGAFGTLAGQDQPSFDVTDTHYSLPDGEPIGATTPQDTHMTITGTAGTAEALDPSMLAIHDYPH